MKPGAKKKAKPKRADREANPTCVKFWIAYIDNDVRVQLKGDSLPQFQAALKRLEKAITGGTKHGE